MFTYAHIACLHTRVFALLRFGVLPVLSAADRDHDLIDDYTDIMRGARAYIRTNPTYKDAYYAGGYPADGEGVCTDVVWRAFKNAGYDLKALVDEDISANRAKYLGKKKQDENIDFRRVTILKTFFERNALSLTTDAAQIDQWHAGDIVIYNGHIAIVSDIRNGAGQPFIIHHAGRGCFEEDALTYKPIVAHFRFTN